MYIDPCEILIGSVAMAAGYAVLIGILYVVKWVVILENKSRQ